MQGYTPTKRAWYAARARCHNPEHPGYGDYGGRGIAMCDRWRGSYEAFLEDMGERPDGLTLDRIDNYGNYEPGNCRWTTMAVQNSNRRPLKPQEFRCRCMECGVSFTGRSNAAFCEPNHKRAFHQRNQKRGQVAMPLLLAWRGGRGQKETSKWAYGEMCRLADLWNAEDRAAGRAPQTAYAELKRRDYWTANDYHYNSEKREEA